VNDMGITEPRIDTLGIDIDEFIKPERAMYQIGG